MNLRICLVRDTYDQIYRQFAQSKRDNPIIHYEDYEKNKKIA